MKKKNKLKILYEDKSILVVYKPSKLLCISTDKVRENTLFHKVVEYLHKKNQKAFIVHRLDKDTSGLVLFAKNIGVKTQLQNNWDKTIRKYYALVIGEVLKAGEIRSFLSETKTFFTYITDNKNKGKLAITKYTPLKSNKKFSLLDVDILTGRKNQIRVQLQSINHPIIGDKKYGNINGSRLMLEAYYLEFSHPVTNELIKIQIDIDKEFECYEKGN